MSNVRINGTENCYEVRGIGPPVLLITGVTDDAGHFTDAAALLDTLGLAPAAVFGSSAGAMITLGLLIRHPDLTRGAILHEPGVSALLDNPEQAQNVLATLVTEGMEVLASEQSQRFFVQTAYRLARRLHVPVVQTPGTHTPYLDQPRDLTQVIRPFLRQVSGVPA
jgi:pimeloyl-ACP methyl ester carboxylesterase